MHKARLCYLTIDCDDLDSGLRFWSEALGAEHEPFDDMDQQIYRRLRLLSSDLRILLQAVPEKKSAKSRVHLDIETDDVETEVNRLKSIGATEVRRVDELGFQFAVLEDPFENEFCVIQPEFPELLDARGVTWPSN